MLPLDQQYDTRTILNKKSNFPNNFCKSIPLKSAPTGCPKKRVTLFVNPGLIEMWSRSRSHLDWARIDRKCNAFFGTPCRYRTCQYYFCFSKSPLWISLESEMGGLGAETLGTETFVVSVPVSVPPRLKMSGLVKVSVSRDFILKSRSRSRFHETQNESLGLGLGSMRPKLKVSVSVSFLRPGKLLVSPITAF